MLRMGQIETLITRDRGILGYNMLHNKKLLYEGHLSIKKIIWVTSHFKQLRQ